MKNTLALHGGNPVITETFEFSWPLIEKVDKDRVLKALERGEVSYNYLDSEVHELENKFKSYIGMNYALALNSGTSALYLAFLAINLKPGDEVIVPTYTFPATVMPLLHLGVKPIFVDSDVNSPNTSITEIEKKINKNTKAIVVTHMDGIPVNCFPIKELADKHKIYLIEDCAQALGAEVEGKKVGSFGDLSIFSLQQKKLVVGGEGGLLLTNNNDMYEKSILFSYLQKRSFNEVEIPNYADHVYTGLGFNFRIHPLAAALANSQFEKIENNLSSRRMILDRLAIELDKLPEIIIPQLSNVNYKNSYYSFKILFNTKEFKNIDIQDYIAALRAEGLTIEKSITMPLHSEKIFSQENETVSDLIYNYKHSVVERKEELFNSIAYCESALRMSPYYDLTEKQVLQIIEVFKKVSDNIDKLQSVSTY